MLSIVIPVYNYDVSELVRELSRQCVAIKVQFEIICLDDASPENCRPDLDLENFRWVEVTDNLGRAKARNKLVSLANYKWLLFLDADMKVINHDFISEYLHNTSSFSVVCGGFHYAKNKPDKDSLLRWNYGTRHEVKSASERSKEPYGSFMTGNFMALKTVLEKHEFDESLTIYGHEDTLFGKALLEDAVKIKHLDNPCLHDGLESNQEFIFKTKEGLKSLNQLYRVGKLTRHYSGIIKLYENLKLFRLLVVSYNIIELLEKWFGNKVRAEGKHLWLFQLLKLKWFIDLQE